MRARKLVSRWFGTCWVLWLGCSRLSATDFSLAPPGEAAMNPEAGRGDLVLIKLRLADGEALVMVMDTGAPGTVLDKSLLPKLGPRLDSVNMHSFDTRQVAGIYAAPKFFLGEVQLATGSNVLVGDLQKLSRYLKPPIKGILGMDCLSHYCVQLDFVDAHLRFLDAAQLNPSALGRSYALQFDLDREHGGVPCIRHSGLLGGAVANTMIDTGNNSDGMTQGRAIRQNARGSYSGGLIRRTKHFLAVEGWVNRAVGSLNCVWDGNAYTNLAVARGPRNCPNWIGLRFLARHLVTFDFPGKTMYLKPMSSGPLPEPVKTNGVAATQKP